MSNRHARNIFFISNRNELRGDVVRAATLSEKQGAFRFSEMVARGTPPDNVDLLRIIATRMTETVPDLDGDIPSGFTYLGQFIDHDLTLDNTKAALTDFVPLSKLEQGRSPALDLDSVYGLGPADPTDKRFYEANGVKFRLGKSIATQGNVRPGDRDLDGFDLPRLGAGGKVDEARHAVISDHRNDENLVVGQTHLAFLRFHNTMVDHLAANGTPSALLFESAQAEVILHYQWIVRHDFLPRIIDTAVLEDVFAHGRKIFETDPTAPASMPIEFSVAAYRLGHSMIREEYDWNEAFNPRPGALDRGTLLNLFRFSGTSGNLNPGSDPNLPLDGTFEKLVTIWVADWTRLYDFVGDGGPEELAPHAGGVLNHARRIDTRMADPLRTLPVGSFGPRGNPPVDPMEMNLAFRNLMRGRMVGLATAQEVATAFQAAGVATPILTSADILGPGTDGVDFNDLSEEMKNELVTATPLWLYILREAEMFGGRMGPIGSRIVAETFHRAIESSRVSLLRQPGWRPRAGASHAGGFGMTDLLRVAYDATKGELRPLSVDAPKPAEDQLRTALPMALRAS